MQGIQQIYKQAAKENRVPIESDLVNWLSNEAGQTTNTRRAETCEDLANRLSYIAAVLFRQTI